MAKHKAPQFLIDDEGAGEKEILSYIGSLSKGDKSCVISDLLIVGMTIEKLDANVFDMVKFISRRGGTLTTERLLQLLKLAAPQPVAAPKTIPEPEP